VRRRSYGFVLIELVVVIVLIGLIAAVAFPALMPVLAFSELENAARRLGGYGESAMAHCALMHEHITVKFDLDEGEYWCVRWPDPLEDLEGAEGADEQPFDLFDLEALAGDPDAVDEEFLIEQSLRMQDGFDRLARVRLEARADNARREDSIMNEFGPLFEKEFTLEIDDDTEEEEVVSPLLLRTRLPEDVTIASVEVAGAEHTRGVAEVDLSPLGLLDPVVITVKGADDDCYTVAWDPVTNMTFVRDGKEDAT